MSKIIHLKGERSKMRRLSSPLSAFSIFWCLSWEPCRGLSSSSNHGPDVITTCVVHTLHLVMRLRLHACLPLHGFFCCTGVLDCVLANIRKRALCTRLAMPHHNNLSWTKHVIEHRTRFVRQIPKDLFCLSSSVLGKQTLTLTLTLPLLIIPRPILLYKKDPT